MKLRYLYSLAALSLLTAGCSSDENTQNPSDVSGQKIPFTAVISADNATTRSLTEAADGKTVTTGWAVDEQVALIHNGVVDVMSVTAVDDKTKAATIRGTISGNPKDGDNVTVIYPASAVDLTTKAVKTDLLKAQDGTLATISRKLDYRTAKTTLAVSEGGSTFGSSVTLALQNAIWKLSLTDGSDALSASKLVIKSGSSELTTVTLTPAIDELYVAMAPADNATLKFEATVGNDVYTYSKTGITLEAGKYYQSTMAMNAPEPETIHVESVELSPTELALTIDETATLVATITPTEAADQTVGWTSSDESIATVDANGMVTAVGAGEATITVTTTDGGKTAECKVTVSKKTAAISFATAAPSQTWSPATADNTYKQTVSNTGDGNVSYSISDNTCDATINPSTGEVKFTKAGSVKVTATVVDNAIYTYATKTATYTLTVAKAAGSIKFTTTSYEKLTTDAAFTNETLTVVGDGKVTYSSDKESVAKVDATTGKVTIVGVGVATITATVADSDTYTYATNANVATYTLTVKDPAVDARDPFGNGGDPLK